MTVKVLNDYKSLVLGAGVAWDDKKAIEVRFLFWGILIEWGE